MMFQILLRTCLVLFAFFCRKASNGKVGLKSLKACILMITDNWVDMVTGFSIFSWSALTPIFFLTTSSISLYSSGVYNLSSRLSWGNSVYLAISFDTACISSSSSSPYSCLQLLNASLKPGDAIANMNRRYVVGTEKIRRLFQSVSRYLPKELGIALKSKDDWGG